VALLANGVRVYITIGAAAAGSTMFVSGPGHYLVGWFVFGIILGIMFLIGTRFELPPVPARAAGAHLIGATSTPSSRPRSWSWSTPGFVGLGLMIVAVAPVSARRITDSSVLKSSMLPIVSVDVLQPWTIVPGMALSDWRPNPQSADAIFDRTYRAGDNTVRMNVALYGAQNGEVGISRRAPGSLGWDVTATGVRTVGLEGRVLSVNESLLSSSAGAVRVWHWYVVDGVTTAKDYTAKLLLAGSRLRGGHRPSGVVALATEDRVGIDSAAALRRFLELLKLDLSSR
jgi:EpsI family protein